MREQLLDAVAAVGRKSQGNADCGDEDPTLQQHDAFFEQLVQQPLPERLARCSGYKHRVGCESGDVYVGSLPRHRTTSREQELLEGTREPPRVQVEAQFRSEIRRREGGERLSVSRLRHTFRGWQRKEAAESDVQPRGVLHERAVAIVQWAVGCQHGKAHAEEPQEAGT